MKNLMFPSVLAVSFLCACGGDVVSVESPPVANSDLLVTEDATGVVVVSTGNGQSTVNENGSSGETNNNSEQNSGSSTTDTTTNLPTPTVAPEKPTFVGIGYSAAYGSVKKIAWQIASQTDIGRATSWKLFVNGFGAGTFTASAPDTLTHLQSHATYLIYTKAGPNTFQVQACNNIACTSSEISTVNVDSATLTGPQPEPTTVARSVQVDQTKRVFVGYYPSWADNSFTAWTSTGGAISDDAVLQRSRLARVPGTYTHMKLAFVKPDLEYSTETNFNGNTWTGTGMLFSSGPKDIKRAIEVLQKRGMKVFLSIGGGSAKNWTGLASEAGSPDGVYTNRLKQMLLDLGIDGLDIDYEVTTGPLKEYTDVIKAIRKAVDLAGNGRKLSLTGHPTGADCTPATGGSACGGLTNAGGVAGRLRMALMAEPQLASQIDLANIMSYDMGYKTYDGVAAYTGFRSLFPSSTIVNIGLESPPEAGTGNAILVVNNQDALCIGSLILKNQYGQEVNLPYSVERFATAVMSARVNANPRDGAMLWHVRKTAQLECGTGFLAATPGTIVKKVSGLFGLPADDRAAWQ